MTTSHVVTALHQGSVHAARLIARQHQDGHHLRALAAGQEWGTTGLIEDIDNLVSGLSGRGVNASNERTELAALREWAVTHTDVIAVWSSHGHVFTTDQGYENCLRCGARYELVHDQPNNPRHGRYRTSNGDDPTECARRSLVHGEGICSEHDEDDKPDCPECHHDCNCLLCTG